MKANTAPMTNATTGASPAELLIPDAMDAALRTLRRNIAAFGAVYPDDTTVDDRYRPRTAGGRTRPTRPATAMIVAR